MPSREKEEEILDGVDPGLVEFEAYAIWGAFSKVQVTKVQMQN